MDSKALLVCSCVQCSVTSCVLCAGLVEFMPCSAVGERCMRSVTVCCRVKRFESVLCISERDVTWGVTMYIMRVLYSFRLSAEESNGTLVG